MVRMKRNDGRGFLARLFGTTAPPAARHPSWQPPAPWQATSPPPTRPAAANGIDVLPVFACSTCGRTDLPEAGGWDPPVCEECDAAINFDWEVQEQDEHQ
jgi:hypothetical protein